LRQQLLTGLRDAAAYGAIPTEGRRRIGALEVATPTMIRFGAMTSDEVFVSAEAASAGPAHQQHQHE
jgi:hypothetical protein